MDEKALFKKRRKIARQIPRIEESIRGSLVIMNRACGKPNCHCLKGQKHKAVYISQSRAGKPRMFYIPALEEQRAHQYIKNYRKVRDVLDRLSDLNLKLVTKRFKHRL
jgi:hypothetical protein